jgi:SAM-dependent methyltransferase
MTVSFFFVPMKVLAPIVSNGLGRTEGSADRRLLRPAGRLRYRRAVADRSPADPLVPLSHLAPEEKGKRANVFGEVATTYERFRPGPPAAAVDWLLPTHLARVVDLGAGTGALTRLLVGRADEVVAVEPDDRMRAVLTAEVPTARAVSGRGEAIPLPDRCADAVLASSSWHWMDAIPALHEVGRVLVPGGALGVVWSGPDPEGPFIAQAQALLAGRATGEGTPSSTEDQGDQLPGDLTGLILGDALRPMSILEIPPGVPFDQPDHQVFTWDTALDADELIGLLGTLSWVITMGPEDRDRLFAEARRLLRDLLGIEGAVTVDVVFRAEAWRSRRTD